MTEPEEKLYHAALVLRSGETFYEPLSLCLDVRDARDQWRRSHEPWPCMIPAESRDGTPVIVMTASLSMVWFFAGPVPSRVGKGKASPA